MTAYLMSLVMFSRGKGSLKECWIMELDNTVKPR